MSLWPWKSQISPVTEAQLFIPISTVLTLTVAGCRRDINEMIYCCWWCLKSECVKFDGAMKNGVSCEAAPIEQG